MDYEKLYKQALERARKGQSVEQIFPELKENDENEDIIKGIIQYLEQSQFGEEHYQIDDDVVRNYIAWLEKQCKQQDKDETSDMYAFKFNRVHGYL